MTGDPLTGRTVVITRPTPGPLGAALSARGAVVGHVPLIEIGPPADGGAALDAALGQLDRFDWLVVTSANGAHRVGDAAARHRGLRLAAVGETTAQILADLVGRVVDVVPAIANVEGLLAELTIKPARMLVAQGDLAGDRLSSGLCAAGHDVVTVAAYRTTLRPPDEEASARLRRADVVVLASGSSVASWSRAATSHPQAPFADVTASIVVIGERTAEIAAAHRLDVTAVAAAPTTDAVVDAIERALGAR